VNFQLGKDALRVVPRSVLADLELSCDRLVGPSLGQELGYLGLSSGKSVSIRHRVFLFGFTVTAGQARNTLPP